MSISTRYTESAQAALGKVADLLRGAGVSWEITHDQQGEELILLTNDSVEGLEGEILSLLPGAALEEEYQDYHGPRGVGGEPPWNTAIFTGITPLGELR